ncbi:MAG: hypothetical protein GXP62_07585 [Oligoflexia bacterium]|nr:hypothetical protein [Oligoflexia bacterium]
MAPAKPLPPIVEHPSSPTLVALRDPPERESSGAFNLADGALNSVPSGPIEPTLDVPDQPETQPTTQPTIAAAAAAPLDPPRQDSQDDALDWEPTQRSSGVPKVLFLVAGLVLIGGLGGTWLRAHLAGSSEGESLQQLENPVSAPHQVRAEPPGPPAATATSPAPVAPVRPVAAPGANGGAAVGTKIETSTDPPVADGWSMPAAQTEPVSAAPAPAPASAAATPAQVSAPVRPAAPVLARIRLTGDPAHVTLKGVRGTFDAARGRVPAGTYQVWVRFDGRADLALSQTGSVTLKTGETVTLRCDQSFAECTQQ